MNRWHWMAVFAWLSISLGCAAYLQAHDQGVLGEP